MLNCFYQDYFPKPFCCSLFYRAGSRSSSSGRRWVSRCFFTLRWIAGRSRVLIERTVIYDSEFMESISCVIYRVFFLTGPPLKCWPVRNWFRKNVRVPDWPPYDQKKPKCLRTSMWFSYLQDLGGASRGIFGGGQTRGKARSKRRPSEMEVAPRYNC